MSVASAVVEKGCQAVAEETATPNRRSTRHTTTPSNATAVIEHRPKAANSRRRRADDNGPRPTTVSRATRSSSSIYEDPSTFSPAFPDAPTNRETLSAGCESDSLPGKSRGSSCKRTDNDGPRPATVARTTSSLPIYEEPSTFSPAFPLASNGEASQSRFTGDTVLGRADMPDGPAPQANKTQAKKGTKESDPAARVNYNDPAVRATINHHADVAQNVLFPSRAIASLGLDEGMSIMGMRLFLARFNREAGGDENDPVFKVLTDQVAITHQRIAKLDAEAEEVRSFAGKKLYLDAAAKLRSELRKMFEAVAAYRQEKRSQRKRSATATNNNEHKSHAKKSKPRKTKNAHRTRR